ncbi:hypothetical protein [Lacipirellula parvula]|uniref:Uncharacterized protein n=1 Tax=Lacipirellula parvula TaxID=2650471 RepID=A0A5K7XJZ5_9BACT|nr:hypothetical protein [Lacipirellula parvula]BBO34573.1 hypothetical protein PLANPX_4185 [Lacipirellula parvula]
MNRLVWTENGNQFAIRDADGFLHFPKATELHEFASTKEIAEARHRYEASQTPLPVYDVAADLYHWGDPTDLWPAEDVAEDIRKLWPGMPVEFLLESSRQMAKLGITD